MAPTPGSSGAAVPARPGRAAVVAADLADLHGPVQGIVELPHRMVWQGADRSFDLSDPDLLAWMYEIVLREAASRAELQAWLHGPTLVRIWHDLYLPRAVQAAWEARHPQLRAHAA